MGGLNEWAEQGAYTDTPPRKVQGPLIGGPCRCAGGDEEDRKPTAASAPVRMSASRESRLLQKLLHFPPVDSLAQRGERGPVPTTGWTRGELNERPKPDASPLRLTARSSACCRQSLPWHQLCMSSVDQPPTYHVAPRDLAVPPPKRRARLVITPSLRQAFSKSHTRSSG